MEINIKKKFLTTACMAFVCAMSWGQGQVTISGRVVDPAGVAVAGAAVLVEGTSNGTITDAEGNYTLSVPAGAKVNVSHGEYGSKTVDVSEGTSVYNVRLGNVIAPAPAPQAQQPEKITISGRVTDEEGNPVPGASVVVGGTTHGTISDNDGNYSVSVPADAKVKFAFLGYEDSNVSVSAGQNVYNVVLRKADEDAHSFLNEKLYNGTVKSFSRKESAMAATVISGNDLDKRLAKSINQSIIGQGSGLTSLDVKGNAFCQNPTWYVRGIHTFDGSGYATATNGPLVLVDGIERNVTTVSPGEVESVTILKDAVATALYGYKATNNVVLVTTKRGQKEGNFINVKYEHGFNSLVDMPEHVNAYEYAIARNEAAAAEGQPLPYSEKDLQAYQSDDPYIKSYFPDVDWVSETFRKNGYSNRYSIDFTGAGKRFRYYTYLNLFSDKGFIKPTERNSGYSTQDFYSRGNLRSNLDVDMTDYTLLKVNIGGILSELNVPGDQCNLWQLAYTLPANVFPIVNTKGEWGGTSTYKGILNPVAQAAGAGYYKVHERGLQADIQLNQSLSMFVDGLGLSGRMSYDNYSKLWENHSKAFKYGSFATSWAGNSDNLKDDLVIGTYFSEGENAELGTGSGDDVYERRASVYAAITYDKQINDDNYLYAQVKWDYENSDDKNANSTIYRQNFSWYSHYTLKNRYIFDLALVGSESSRLAPDHKWDFSPNVALGWVVSNEDFLSGNSLVNFLKVRASAGLQNADYIPNGSWSYWTRAYSKVSGGLYLYNDTYQGGNQAYMYTSPVEEFTNENALKVNVGLDMRLLDGLDLTFDWYRQFEKNIWVPGTGAYSAVFALSVPYVNKGEVTSGGVELSLDYNKKFGMVALNAGGSINYTHDEIKEMAEEARAYSNLVETGSNVKAVRGLIAEGLFQSQAEIDAAPEHTFSTVRPGDIRYKDVNGDGKVDANDKVKIGYSTTLPEVFYNFHVGVDVKGIGLNADFQGVGRFTAIKNTQGYYWGLTDNSDVRQYKRYYTDCADDDGTKLTVSNQTIAKEVYDDHWTAENPNAKYPRMAYQANANNYQTSTFWMEDRSFLKLRNVELYYNFSNDLLRDTFIEKARVYVRGVDLFTFDKMENVDAASFGIGQPLTRSIIAGLELSF